FLAPSTPDFDHAHPLVGELAPDFFLHDLDGNALQLSQLAKNRSVVIEFGAITNISCMSQIDPMDALAKKYEGTIEFVFIYCEHRGPEHEHAPETMEERQAQARMFREVTKIRRLVLIDEFGDRSMKRQYSSHGNSFF